MNARIYVVVACLLLAGGCVKRLHRTVLAPDHMETLDRRAPYLKVHMKDGRLWRLSPWHVDEQARQVTGEGTLYAADRTRVRSGPVTIAVDSVAVFETNVVRASPTVAALGIVTGVTAGVAVYCAANPKACFGSCPTFYVTNGSEEVLQAEGFSASIAPSLEATDLDALYRARPSGREVRIHMANEAYETHVVRHADLLAVPKAPGRRVLADATGRFWSVPSPVPPTRCRAPEGSCGAALAAFDGDERWSEADSTDLGAREILELTFAPSSNGRPALVIASRQSLLPTYLLYQGLAWLGTRVGDWMAALGNPGGSALDASRSVVAALGGIDVLVPDTAGRWDSVATIRETGPLAADVRLVPLPPTRDSIRVRLRMARGAWRLDQVALTELGRPVRGIRLPPARVVGPRGVDSTAREELRDPDRVLVTYPGDRYTLVYRLPDDAERFELFLETRGYYLEWMREEWIREENGLRAAELLLDPRGTLRRLAPAYKRVEPGLEDAFWRSKYAGFRP